MSPCGQTHGIIRCGVHSAPVLTKYRDGAKNTSVPQFSHRAKSANSEPLSTVMVLNTWAKRSPYSVFNIRIAVMTASLVFPELVRLCSFPSSSPEGRTPLFPFRSVSRLQYHLPNVPLLYAEMRFRAENQCFPIIFLVFAGFRSLCVFPLYGFRQLHDPNGKIACPCLVIECTGADHLTAWKQAMPFCVTDTGIQRPFLLSDLCDHPGHERLTGMQLMGLPRTAPIEAVHCFAMLGTVTWSASPV